MLSEQPVAQMRWDLADLRSRMRGVAMASIDLPDDALVYALLEKYFTDRQLLAPPAMLRYLVSRMERSFDAVQKSRRRLIDGQLPIKNHYRLAWHGLFCMICRPHLTKNKMWWRISLFHFVFK